MTSRGIEFEADPRHAEIVVREFGLEEVIPSKVPGAKADGDTDKQLPKNAGIVASIQQNNIDAGAVRTFRKNRQKAFGKCIWDGIRPNEAKGWTDGSLDGGGAQRSAPR